MKNLETITSEEFLTCCQFVQAAQAGAIKCLEDAYQWGKEKHPELPRPVLNMFYSVWSIQQKEQKTPTKYSSITLEHGLLLEPITVKNCTMEQAVEAAREVMQHQFKQLPTRSETFEVTQINI